LIISGGVTDLKVVAMQVDQMSVTIQWTAPGQELDNGTGNPLLSDVALYHIIRLNSL
jgi:hypothetical protein